MNILTKCRLICLEPSYDPDMVLPIDKLENRSLVRDISVISGINTFYMTRDQQGRSIVRERDINWLLRGAHKEIINEDDLLFLICAC